MKTSRTFQKSCIALSILALTLPRCEGVDKPPASAAATTIAAGKAVPETGPASELKQKRPREQRPIRWVNPLRREVPGVEHQTIYSPSMKHDVGFNIYLPPAYAESDQRYPVIYWLHGAGGNEGTGVRLSQFYHEAILGKKCPPLIMVFVNGGRLSMYGDHPDRNLMAETHFIKELIPHIDKNYRTIAERQGRALEGFSMGGFGAVKLLLKYPEMFCSAVSYAGALHGGRKLSPETETQPGSRKRGPKTPEDNPYELARKKADVLREDLRLRLVVGTRDPTLKYNKPFQELLKELDYSHEYEVLWGIGHNPLNYYELVGDKGIAFHTTSFAWASGKRPKLTERRRPGRRPPRERPATRERPSERKE